MPSGHSGSIFGEKPSQRVGRAYRGAVGLHRLASGEEAQADDGGMGGGGYTTTAVTAAPLTKDLLPARRGQVLPFLPTTAFWYSLRIIPILR